LEDPRIRSKGEESEGRERSRGTAQEIQEGTNTAKTIFHSKQKVEKGTRKTWEELWLTFVPRRRQRCISRLGKKKREKRSNRSATQGTDVR